jgi:hypothetical protein
MISYDELSGESSEDGFKGHLEALDDVLPEGIDPPGSQVRANTKCCTNSATLNPET